MPDAADPWLSESGQSTDDASKTTMCANGDNDNESIKSTSHSHRSSQSSRSGNSRLSSASQSQFLQLFREMQADRQRSDDRFTQLLAQQQQQQERQQQQHEQQLQQQQQFQQQQTAALLQLLTNQQANPVQPAVPIVTAQAPPTQTVSVPEPRRFSGSEEVDGQTFDEWLIQIRQFAEKSAIEPLVVFEHYLSGNALRSFHSLDAVLRSTYDNAVTHMRPLVQPVLSKTLTALQLLSLHQNPGESITGLVACWRHLFCKLNGDPALFLTRGAFLQALDGNL